MHNVVHVNRIKMDKEMFLSDVRNLLDEANRYEIMKTNGILSRRHNPESGLVPLEFVEVTTHRKLYGGPSEALFVTYIEWVPCVHTFWFQTQEAADMCKSVAMAAEMRYSLSSRTSTDRCTIPKSFLSEPVPVKSHGPLEWWKLRQYEPLAEDRAHVCDIIAHILKTVPLATEAIAEALLYLKEHPQESIDLALAIGSAEWNK